MPSVSVELRNIAGTEAALGWAGAHTVVIDRPESRAGGRGLQFNGAQLALTIGGCFCNDLRYVAHATGVDLGAISVSATVELEGDPILATTATMVVSCETLDGSSAESIIEKAKAVCMAINSLRRGSCKPSRRHQLHPGQRYVAAIRCRNGSARVCRKRDVNSDDQLRHRCLLRQSRVHDYHSPRWNL